MTLIRGGWPNHPAAKMWNGYFYHLGLYLLEGIKVLAERGKDYPVVKEKILAEMAKRHYRNARPNIQRCHRFYLSF